MKWFKHLSNGRRGDRLQLIYSEFGYHKGYALFFMLLEVVSDRFVSKEVDQDLFKIPLRELLETLQIKRSSLVQLGQLLCSSKLVDEFYIDATGFHVNIRWRQLSEITDNYSKKVRTQSGQKFSKSFPQIKNKIKNKIKKENNNIAANLKEPSLSKNEASSDGQASSLPVVNKSLNLKIWDTYRNAYFLRYKKEPVRNAMVNKNISDLGKRLGEDAISVVAFYLNHPSEFYIKNCHAIKNCLHDAESLHTQWHHNKPITERQVKEFTKKLDQEIKFSETISKLRDLDAQEEHQRNALALEEGIHDA